MKLLVLAGTGEATRLIERLAADHDVVASLAGATRVPKLPNCETRIGGFGGEAGFLDWLDQHKPDGVIDATHPFAHRISNRTWRLCRAQGVPYLQVLRPAWLPDAGKGQREVTSISDIRKIVPRGARLFLATGRQTLQDFRGFDDCHLVCRQIDPPDGPFPFPNGEFLIGRPPFSVEDEMALFDRLKIDWLIVKNAGGAASYSKIEAAGMLGIPVLMLERPVQPDGPKVATVAEAVAWVDRLADH